MAKDERPVGKSWPDTRYVTVVLGLVLGVAYYFMVRNKYNALDEAVQSGGAAWFGGIVIVLCLPPAPALMMWLGEQINEKGIGNGIHSSVRGYYFPCSGWRDPPVHNIFYQAGIQQLSDGTGLKYVFWCPSSWCCSWP